MPEPSYLTCGQYLGKDLLVCAGSNRGSVRLYDQSRGGAAPVAAVREIPGVYDLDVSRKVGNKFVITSGSHLVTMEYNK